MIDQKIFLLKVIQSIEIIKFDYMYFICINKMYLIISTPLSWVWGYFGLAYSPINSAKLGCSSKVMLANNEQRVKRWEDGKKMKPTLYSTTIQILQYELAVIKTKIILLSSSFLP